jgi:hypothetical protein
MTERPSLRSQKSASRKYNGHHINLSAKDFIESAPFVRKSYDIFTDGNVDEDIIYSRNMMHTPPEIKKRILEANLEADKKLKKELAAIQRNTDKKEKKKIKKDKKMMNFRLDSDTFNANKSLNDGAQNHRDAVKTLNFHSNNNSADSHDNNEHFNERGFIQRLDSSDAFDEMFNNKRKNSNFRMPPLGMIPPLVIHNHMQEKSDILNQSIEDKAKNDADRKEDKEMMKNRSKNSASKKNIIGNSKKNEFLIVNRDKYFGLKSKEMMNTLFQNSKNDFYSYPNISDLPEEKRTPRSLYMREVAVHNLIPLPLLLRKDTTPFDVSLAHR